MGLLSWWCFSKQILISNPLKMPYGSEQQGGNCAFLHELGQMLNSDHKILMYSKMQNNILVISERLNTFFRVILCSKVLHNQLSIISFITTFNTKYE